MSRVGDIGVGICPAHISPVPYVTMFVTGASTSMINSLPITYVTTIGVSTCGHITIALTGSSTVMVEGLPMHRVGDIGVNAGPYVAVSGSGDTHSGG